MKHRGLLYLALASIFMLAVFQGCSKDDPVEANESEEMFFTSVGLGNQSDSKDLFLTDAEALDEWSQLKSLIPGLKKSALAPLTPLRWGRRIDSTSRMLVRPITKSGDTVAIATIRTVFNGRFIVQGISGVDTVVIHKPYVETVERSVRFERIANTQYPRLNWKLDAVSVLNGGTVNPPLAITKVEVVLPNETFTVTDPDTYFMQILRRWLRGMPTINNVPVTLRVTVQSPKTDADIVTVHHLPGAFGLHHSPMPMISETQNGGGYLRVFEKSWTISGNARKFANLMVSATTKESLHDNTVTNFASVVWGIPYKHSN